MSDNELGQGAREVAGLGFNSRNFPLVFTIDISANAE